MSNESARDLKVPLTEKQVKLLHWTFKLEQLIDDAVHTLVEEVNSQEITAYQKKTEGENSTLQIEEEMKTIHNLTTNLISEEKLPIIPKEIQEVIDHHPKVISKEE